MKLFELKLKNFNSPRNTIFTNLTSIIMKSLILSLLLTPILFGGFTSAQEKNLFKKVREYSATLENEFDQIPDNHRQSLEQIGDYLLQKLQSNKDAKVLLISRHNSRRSHMGQLWLMTAAEYYGIGNVATFSGGIEPTELDSRVIRALKKCGFKISTTKRSENPTYLTSNGPGNSYMVFAKQYNGGQNPTSDFIAVVLSEVVNKKLETIPGADKKVPMLYEDLENFDGSPEEERKYDEGCRQIARAMFYVMQYTKKNLNI